MQNNSHLHTIFIQGLWHNNPGIVQLLGLCPLLAVSNTTINGFTLGIATLFVLVGSNVCVSLCRHWIPFHLRIPIFILLIATGVTVIELLLQAISYSLFLSLGIFIPLIVTNCAILARAEVFASRNNWLPSFIDGLGHGIGFLCVLTLLGALREILSSGTLFSGIEQLLGTWTENWTLQIFSFDQSFLLAALPPGAFFGLGLLIALKNSLDEKKNNNA